MFVWILNAIVQLSIYSFDFLAFCVMIILVPFSLIAVASLAVKLYILEEVLGVKYE